MRTSGRGKSEWLLFIAPAAIFGLFFIWMYGTPLDAIVAVDRFVMKIINWTIEMATTAVHAISR